LAQEPKQSQLSEKTDKSDRRRSSLDRESRRAIGKQLQSLYDEVLQAPIPERFEELLKRLDEPGGKGSGA
jgi:hypothetical protein